MYIFSLLVSVTVAYIQIYTVELHFAHFWLIILNESHDVYPKI